ncbi:DUF4384 domain-containing protein [Pseudoponticoccus marisrubri]|uniref:DUF4384 domain-containing protein n=1 Tax=Pseudoponticoccus marisrubri TaxID=1685382 RepID=A0A0W7WFJ6_9RHOB|nr:DUF4384 domain-containing protein [Pseudoponticoccus marisrubri]KUF09330.1 hypothetical protein AVJ23_17965 [Pseudoponticoccus marisrubri]
MQASDVIKAVVVAVAGMAAAPALASDAMPLPDDATEAEAAAYEVLGKYCAGCHQDGALEDGLTKAKDGFGHVLDIRRLSQDPKLVASGEPSKSKLYQVITGGSPPMPDDCWTPDCAPSAEDLAKLEEWIVALGETAPEPREFITLEKMYEMVHADIQAQPTQRRDRIRYLSMRPMWNDGDVSEENYQAYLAATVKLLNALSWNPEIYTFEKIDEHGTLFRIFLPDLHWEKETWHLLEARYPYAMQSKTDPYLSQIQHLTDTKVPVIRADWFTATASVSPLYYDMLGLPETVAGLENMLGIDMKKNILNEQVIRAGFQDSGVSTHNRLIERHPMGTGFFWTSYDFAGSKGRQSFFEYPLGPDFVYGPELAFEHDGGESIFTLPNGFHAYYLNTADGERLDVGPTQIVRDTDYPDGTGEVVNGISCISCHSKGIRFNDDTVREVALNNLALPAHARQTIDAIYPGQDAVNEVFQEDMDAFLETLTLSGIDPDTKAAGLEPVRGLFVYHVDYFLDFAQAANELGLTEEDLTSRMGFAGTDMAGLLNRLHVSPIARDEWNAAYPVLLERLTDYAPLKTEFKPVAHLPASVKKVVDGTDYAPEPKPAGHTAPPAKKPHVDTSYDDVVASKKDAPAYDPVQHSVPAQSHLTVYTDQPTYKVGEELKIIIEPRHDCRLTLISIDDDHDSCVLYPFPGLEDIVIKGGEQYVFPPRGALRTSEPGLETILAICNGGDKAISAATRDTTKVSCAAGHKPISRDQYSTVVNETLILSLDDEGPDHKKASAPDVDYRALSDHNPDVIKAQISVPVSEH